MWTMGAAVNTTGAVMVKRDHAATARAAFP